MTQRMHFLPIFSNEQTCLCRQSKRCEDATSIRMSIDNCKFTFHKCAFTRCCFLYQTVNLSQWFDIIPEMCLFTHSLPLTVELFKICSLIGTCSKLIILLAELSEWEVPFVLKDLFQIQKEAVAQSKFNALGRC